MSAKLPGEGTAPMFGDHTTRIEALERNRPTAFGNRRKSKPKVPSASIYRTANQGIPDATDTTIAFTAKRWDTEGIWNGGSGLVCRTAGLYLISASVKWATDNTGQRSLHVLAGATIIIDDHRQPGDASFGIVGQSVARSWRLAVGDVVTATVLQQTTAPFGPQTLDVLAASAYSPELAIAWMGH